MDVSLNTPKHSLLALDANVIICKKRQQTNQNLIPHGIIISCCRLGLPVRFTLLQKIRKHADTRTLSR